jgi:hypothetical protein
MALCLLLEALQGLFAGLFGAHAVGFDALFAVRGQLGLPVALAALLLVDRVLLVSFEVGGRRVG